VFFIPNLLHNYTKMPPQRTPLSSISGNRPRGSEISPYIRGQIKGQANRGATQASIAKDLNLVKSTVQYTLQQDELRNNGQSLLRKPRGKSYTDGEERLLLRHVRLNPKDTYKQVIIACNLSYKPTTVKKILKKHGIRMDRDFESAKHGYSARSYLEVCEAEVAPIFQELDDGYLFMQDNASIHTAYSVRDWFTAHGITQITNWPAYSPDLNPIEHIWWHLKVRVYEMFPEVAADKSESEHARQRLESCIQAAWDTLDKGIFDNLYASMPARMAACIAAGGWHTKY
jgi:hypothetical protein